MAVIKVACPKCGQKVSGDESFIGTEVECPICSSAIRFPGELAAFSGAALPKTEPAGGEVPSTHIPVPPEKPKGYDDTSEVGHDVVQRRPDDEGDSSDGEREKSSGSSRERRRKRTSSKKEGISKEEEEDDFDDLPPSPIFGAVSIVSAVLTVVSCFSLGIIFAPIAIISGHVALAKARHSPVQPAPGHTLGAIGLMVGYVSLAITIILLAVAAFFGEDIRDYFQSLE
ncbi:DUF4190 domain-containing protein [Verrucomicrobiales bacterium BCK34]|nr:DUF4190 domain-containing protein [Verrucomicrobiales bacterium BCK34]